MKNLNVYGCGLHTDNCVVKTNADSEQYCIDKCRFNPVTPSESNYESFEMVTNRFREMNLLNIILKMKNKMVFLQNVLINVEKYKENN